MAKGTLKIHEDVFNEVYLEHMLKNDKRYQIYYGGASSGKSYSLAQRTVLDVIQGRNYLITRNTQNTIRKSVMNEVTKSISSFKLTDFFDVNKTSLEITCNLNNKQILFAGLDDTEKIKSITPISGVITDIWMEEATEAEYKSYKQLDKRLRGKSQFNKRLSLSFNPVLKDHWIYKEFFDIWEDDKQYVENNNTSILKTTYKDNYFLGEDDIKALENESDRYYYEVYTLGNWGILGSLIYKDWSVVEFDYSKMDNVRYGIDWGFFPDPFAFIALALDEKSKKIYIFDEVYQTNLLPDESAEIIKNKVGKSIVTCDSANPSEIKQFQNKGINARPAKKGAGSIDSGIQYIQQFEIIIHPKCINFKIEISKYRHKEDRNGNILPIPVDKDNHLMDAMRYALENDMLGNKGARIKGIGSRTRWH